MRLLQVWQVGGVCAAVCQVQAMPADQVLQQGVPEERLAVASVLVPAGERGVEAVGRTIGVQAEVGQGTRMTTKMITLRTLLTMHLCLERE